MNKSLRLFRKVNIFGDKNSKIRLISTGILAVNLPLIGYTFYFILHPQLPLGVEIFFIILLATISSFFILNQQIRKIEKSIIKATQALNHYFETGDILEHHVSCYYEIDNLFKAIENSILKTEEKIVNFETIITSRQEEFCQIYVEREIAENHLRQCLGIASRHHLPLCIACVSIEGIDSLENSDFLTNSPPKITAIIQRLQQLLRESDWVVQWGDQEFLLAIFSELPGTKLALSRILTHLFSSEESPDN
ncbi:MAG: hypothetical protein ACKPFF_08560, partial [Planktothrix sp.]